MGKLMAKKKVLFVCVHNSARSQMTEAFLEKYGRDRFEVESAGLEPGRHVPCFSGAGPEASLGLSGPFKVRRYKRGKTGKDKDCAR